MSKTCVLVGAAANVEQAFDEYYMCNSGPQWWLIFEAVQDYLNRVIPPAAIVAEAKTPAGYVNNLGAVDWS